MPSAERLAGAMQVARREAHAGAGAGEASGGHGDAARPLRPLRVLHVVTGLEIGGTELLLHKLLGATDRARVEPTVLSLRGGGPVRERIAALGVPTFTLDMRGALPTPGALARLLRVARAQRPDVVHGWLVHGNVAATVAAAATGAPLLWSVRAGLADLANEPLTSRLVLRASVPLARRPRRILYNSARSAAEHEAFGYPADRRLVVPNGFDVERFRPDAAARTEVRAEFGVAADAPLVGLFARWHPQKDHATFLRAAARLRARRPDAVFLLAGSDVTPSNLRIAEQVRALGLGDAVRLLGPRADVARLVAALDVATLTSRVEAFPNVVGEAMAAGVPCASTDVGDVRELIGETGCVVPAGDDAALADAWTALLDEDPVARRSRGASARARIVARFSLDVLAVRYGALYEELAGVGRSAW